MSDSRLEKFIYAICSMDVTDLPVPLSRIEKLWNCLITGETPDFEPLSRNEKYLMAMLDRYDISNLPAPMSRGEKLLYKIAVGETDLSDVPGYLSRYEELLKYLIENGGISGGDFEYVLHTFNQSLYTLYTTAEKPVKSAILKGQTLVNVVSSYGFGGDNKLYESRFYERPFNAGETFTIFVVNPNISAIKIGKHGIDGGWLGVINQDVSINKKLKFTVPENQICKYVGVVVTNENDSIGFENGLVIVAGDQTHLDIDTYFDGMPSVRMPVLTTSNGDGTKTNILTVNEDVTLRSNGDICDELNLLTGQLTQRIGEDGVVLSQEVIKTVDLTVVDQDNQPTQLGTFENITHVSLESAGLIPEVEMEVATNLLEDTVFNLTDAFNTLYPTAAKPVVDGTLTGQTLVNIKGEETNDLSIPGYSKHDFLIPLVKKNTDYLIKYNTTLSEGALAIGFLKDNSSWSKNLEKQPNIGLIRLNSGEYPNYFRIIAGGGQTIAINNLMVIEYQQGMENWDIPYFEGMQSVQAPGITMVGKNLFDGVSYIDGYIFPSGGPSTTTNVKHDSNVTSILLNVDKNTDYILSTKTSFDRGWVAGSLESIKVGSKVVVLDHDTVSNMIRFNSGEYTYIMIYLNNGKINMEEIQVEKGTAATPYEPYKSTTLSTPSDLELRGIGDVRDEVNVMTGEVVERIGEVVLDGSESWRTGLWGNQVEGIGFEVKIKNNVNPSVFVKAISDKILYNTSNNFQNDGEYFDMVGAGNGETWIRIRILRSKLSTEDVEGFKKWLSQNNVKILYELSDKPIKTVDLTVVNQDGNETKLRTFDDTTHVLLQSEAEPNPGASLTVRTKIPSASSTSLLMDDISTEQQQLETTVDEQSENVDATMIATTEIYEETL